MPRHVGIWGGSFDPVHVGHLILAQEALVQCPLDHLVWVPAGDPPHKRGPQASGEDRVRMVELAIAGHEAFSVSRAEVDRKGKSYTVRTLEDVRASSEPDDRLFLLIGSDNAVDFDQWHAPEQVADLAEIVVFDRPGHDRSRIPDAYAARMRFLDTPLIEISSTAIRERIAARRPTRYWVPDDVARWIEAQGLYT